ncbi:MAG: LPS export ABC transporter periplasmic protein LptC [Pseudomonadota bacterium]|nr:LPS export ABC transporter periplasmic protein LptC [Pseudomonadota bacterium]
MNWRLALTLLLLVGATVTGWSLWSQRAPTQAEAVAGTQPDYVLNDFELITLDKLGNESFSVSAPTLRRDPGTQALDITTPLFQIPAGAEAGGGDWEVRARTGWVSPEGDELRLRGDVVADSTGDDGAPVKIATQELNVFPDGKRATSAVAVTVTQPGLIITGRDLEARLDTKRVLLQDTKTRYEITPR